MLIGTCLSQPGNPQASLTTDLPVRRSRTKFPNPSYRSPQRSLRISKRKISPRFSTASSSRAWTGSKIFPTNLHAGKSRQLPEREESNERKMKHVINTQWVNTPTRERLAATRKRTLRSAAARSARSVWSKCQSRVIESRNRATRQGLPVFSRGDSTAMHIVRRSRNGAQATCRGARPGSESRAKAYGGMLESWESPHRSLASSRKRTTPAHQRPGAWAALPAVHASEMREAVREPASEGNRSARASGGGSLSRLIGALESRETITEGSL